MKVASDPACQPAFPVGSARLSSRPRWAPLSGCAVLPAGTVIASLTGTFAPQVQAGVPPNLTEYCEWISTGLKLSQPPCCSEDSAGVGGWVPSHFPRWSCATARLGSSENVPTDGGILGSLLHAVPVPLPVVRSPPLTPGKAEGAGG